MVVRRIVARAELSQQEMLVIFSMVAVGSAFTGHDNMPRLMGQMPYAHRFASPENDWRALFFHHLPNWLIISDSTSVQDFYGGELEFFHRRLSGALDDSNLVMVDCHLSPNGYLSLPDHDHAKTVGRERKTFVSNNPNSLRNNGTVRGNVWIASVSHRFRDTGGNRFNQWASRRPTERTTNRYRL